MESALASALISGEGATAIAPVSRPKEAGTEEAPACLEAPSSGRHTAAGTTQPGKAPASLGNAKRGCTRVNEQAPLGVHPRLSLRVIEGGRPAGGGGSSRAAYRSTAGRGRGSNLKLVV